MPSSHVENSVYPGRRLGRRPHDPTRPSLRLANYLTGVVPAHPKTVDYASRVGDWLMLGNDTWGDCGPVAVCHSRMQTSLYLGGAEQTFTTSDALALYKAVNPEFDPGTGAGDNGVVLADMFSKLASVGVAGVKPLGFAQVDVSNVDEVRAAIALFGSVILGVDLDVAQQAQTDHGGPWDYRPSSVWGGHAVLAVEYASDPNTDFTVVSWGKTIGMTEAFEAHQITEAWVVVWPEHLGSTEFLAGVDVKMLASDWQMLTGRPFPASVVPPVSPSPTPGHDPVDVEFAAVLKPWAKGFHPFTGTLRNAAKKWLTAKGL